MKSQAINFQPLLEKYKSSILFAANALWDYPETAFEEYRSSGLLKAILKEQGFQVETPSPSLPTAFTARFGKGRPILGLLGEYDALPGLSQKADLPSQEPISPKEAGAPGHGCGHNLLGAGLLCAALFIKDLMEQEQLPGTLVFLGCPAEENFAGKSKMAELGFFKDLDAAFSWHPHFQSGLFNQSLANQRVSYKFHGKSAHASQSPHLGRSALDACELMNVGVNYLREHMPSEDRVHYAYVNAGGPLPNLIPSEAELLYAIRAPKSREAAALRARVDNIARGAALMTETSLEIETLCVYDSLLPNKTLDRLTLKYLQRFSPIAYTQEELHYAQSFLPFGSLPDSSLPILTEPDLSPLPKTGISTDVGNVSQLLPCSAFFVSCYASGSPLHSWTVTAQGKSSVAHKGMFSAAKILSSCALELFQNPVLIKRAWEDFKAVKA